MYFPSITTSGGTIPFSLLLLLLAPTSSFGSLSSTPPPAIPISSPAPISIPTTSIPLHLNHQNYMRRRSNPEVLRNWALREKGKIRNKYGEYVVEGETSEGSIEKRENEEKSDEGFGVELEKRATTPLAVAGYGTQTNSPTTTTPSNNGTSTVAPGPTSTVGLVLVENEEDLEYYASVGVGVPPQYMNVILDTGSADLWIANTLCTNKTGCPSTLPRLNSSLSKTIVNDNNAFSVKYGSGAASGSLWEDFVGFGGYNVSSQGFALVNTVSEGLLTGNISGLMGLGFQSLAASGVTPFWQNLFQAGVLPFPGFAFQLTRFVNTTSTASYASTSDLSTTTPSNFSSTISSGGSLTLGYLNSSLYTGSINYIPIPAGQESYWLIPMEGLLVNGTNVTALNTPMVAIDTGTTLIGGPTNVVRSLYGMIPGAMPATGAYAGYYSYPCNLKVNVTLGFGGQVYNMTSEDFNLGSFGSQGNVSTCLGAFFDLNLSPTSRITWVIGAAFLKNVYSVYRASPPSVGFARLSNLTSFNSSSPNAGIGGGIYNITIPPGIFGPSAVTFMKTSSIQPDSITTAIQAGQTASKVNSSGAGRATKLKGLKEMMAMVLSVAVGVYIVS